MATVKPFAALRPKSELASRICELPYDVMSSEEARVMAAGNPLSFLHVSKPEIDLPAAKIGVFGKLRQFSELARPGDRIEIYRPLVVDPKESRRRRAQHKSRATAKAPGG